MRVNGACAKLLIFYHSRKSHPGFVVIVAAWHFARLWINGLEAELVV